MNPETRIALLLSSLDKALESFDFSQARRDAMLVAATPAIVDYYMKGQ